MIMKTTDRLKTLLLLGQAASLYNDLKKRLQDAEAERYLVQLIGLLFHKKHKHSSWRTGAFGPEKSYRKYKKEFL